MTVSKPDMLGMTGLLFFGSMSSSNFHEIKNALAIINENAGLLDDIAHACEDAAIDPDRLKTLSDKICKQVKRADNIIRNINRFSHSVEKFAERVDLGETVRFVIQLSERQAAIRGITVKTGPMEGEIRITTSPFFLENLIWLCLDFAMGHAGEGNTVEITVQKAENGGQIRFARLENMDAGEEEKAFPSKEEMSLISALGAKLEPDTEAGELVIALPENCQWGKEYGCEE